MPLLGYALLCAGIALSVAVIAHDIRRRRIARLEPQAAPRRLGPELHMVAALFTGAGAWLAWDLTIALAAMLPQALLVTVLILDMMEQNR